MKVPFLELKRQYHSIKSEVDGAIKETLENGSFILGEKVTEFENAFARYCNAKSCLSVGSGTEALHIALRALGVGPGDEVIIPSHTFIATGLAVWYTGAKPVFADIDPETYCVSPESIKKAISPRTKAIMPVHMYGQYADMDAINELARKRSVAVVEDAAQSHGAEYKGKRKVLGTVACYSFYPTKNLGAYGDGGAIVTDDADIAGKITMLRNYGQKKKYEHTMKGFNSRLDEIQAAILIAKLKHLDGWIEKRRKIASEYNKLLSSTNLGTPVEAKYGKHAYYLYVIRSKDRDELQKHLEKNGIGSMIHYPIPIHKQEAFSDYNSQRLPDTEKAAEEVISLPMFPELTAEEVKTVAEAVKSFK